MIQYLCGMDYRTLRRRAKIKEICAKNVYPWLREVGEKFKRFGAYPLCLSDYYKDPMDKQVAEMVSLMIPPNNRQKLLIHFFNILGDSLWERVKNRNFMEFAREGWISTAVCLNSSLLFNVLDWIWEACCAERVPPEYVILGEMGIITRHHRTPLEHVLPLQEMRYRLELLLAKMTLRDGFGVGLWEFLPEESIPCPFNSENKKVLSTFYPIQRDMKAGNEPNILSFMGFEKQIDFLYSAWGYQYLKKKEPRATSDFEKKLDKWRRSLLIRQNLRVEIPTDCIE